jgi:peptide/nickel transport system substrate-binding protein
MTFLRRNMLFAGSALALLTRTASAQGTADQGTAATPLRHVQPWDIRSLRMDDAGYHFTRAGITETLVRTTPAGAVEPALALSWSVEDGGTVWRFRLREGVRFHDGTPMTAPVVQASFERLLPRASYLAAASITAVRAEQDAIVFTLARPFGSLPVFLADPSCPILAPAAFDAAGDVVRLIGTGPFRAIALDLPRGLTAERNPGYWGSPSALARLRYDAVNNAETRANIAVAGDADLVLNLPTPSVARVERGGMTVLRAVIPRVHILMPNAAKPQFSSPRLREALSLAIDRDAIASGIMRNPALAARHYLPDALRAWIVPDLAPLRLDVARANALLESEGWARGADGIRVREGVRFAATVRTYANRPELPIIATALQQQLRAIGFALDIRVGESTAITEGQRDGSLELGLSSRNTAILPDPITTLAADFTTDASPAGAVGQTNWRNDDIRRDVAAYLAEADEARRQALRRSIVATLQQELPVIPIVWYDQIVAVSRTIDGFVIDPFEMSHGLDRIRRR